MHNKLGKRRFLRNSLHLAHFVPIKELDFPVFFRYSKIRSAGSEVVTVTFLPGTSICMLFMPKKLKINYILMLWKLIIEN